MALTRYTWTFFCSKRDYLVVKHGCFWHAHEGCKYASKPKSNVEFWEQKFARNKARDKRVKEQLESEGWHVVVIWECELKKDRIEQTRQRLHDEIEYAFVDV